MALNSLLASRTDYSDPTTSDISETDMETPELSSDDEEHPKRILRVFDLRQEAWVQPER